MSQNVPTHGPVTTNDYQRMSLEPAQHAPFQQPQPIHAGMEAGESRSFRVEIHQSLFLRYLKTQLRCTSTRFEYQTPKVVLGFIKTGTVEHVIPIQSITRITTGKRFNPAAFFGFIFLLILTLGFIQLPPVFLVFLFLTFRALSFVYTAHLRVTNSSGEKTNIGSSIYAADRLEHFANELKSRTFTGWGAVRHEEHQQVQIAQLEMQRMMLQQQIELQQQLLNSMQIATHAYPNAQPQATTQLDHSNANPLRGFGSDSTRVTTPPSGSPMSPTTPHTTSSGATASPMAPQAHPGLNRTPENHNSPLSGATQTRLPVPPPRFLSH